MTIQPVHIRVRTYELDSFGHVNNSVYLNYLEEARSEFLRQLNLSFNDLETLGVQLIIAEAHIHYHSYARYGDTILVAGAFRDIKAVTLYTDYRLTIEESGRLVATAWTKGAFVDAGTGKPTRAPQLLREAFLAVQNARADGVLG